jgi:diacylglycerol kinase (ATP)
VERWLALHARDGEIGRCQLSGLECAPLPAKRVVVIGGDGTVNAALSWLHARGCERVLGIVPAGTGNNLARGLGLPLEPARACEVAFLSDKVRRIDGIAYRGSRGACVRWVVQSASLGFPAEIAARYDRLRRHWAFRALTRPLGSLTYKMLAFLGLAAQKRREKRGEGLLRLQCRLPALAGAAPEVLEETVLALFIHNERTIGGGFVPCPEARVDDGLLDLCTVRAGTGTSYLRIFRAIARGEHLRLSEAVACRQTPGPVELVFSQPTPLVSDGDVWLEDERYLIELLPGLFAVSVP